VSPGSEGQMDLHRIFHEGGTPQRHGDRKGDDSLATEFRHKSSLWKMKSHGSLLNKEDWQKRDMWLTPNGNICYFSPTDDRRLIFVSADMLHGAKVEAMSSEETARGFAFQIQPNDDVGYYLAATSEEDQKTWIEALKNAADLGSSWWTGRVNLGQVNEDLKEFRITVKNRRRKIDKKGAGFDKEFEGKLWKVKGEYDPQNAENWIDRDYWVTQNGTLVYYSKLAEDERIYFTASDIENSTIQRENIARQFAFSITLKIDAKGLAHEPAMFAAESEAKLEEWLKLLVGHGASAA